MTRQQIAQSTAAKLASAASTLPSIKTLIGFDAFVDEICDVVDKRHDAHRYEPIKTIEQLGQKIVAAACQSCNYELVVKTMKLGGNGPIMANALASAGLTVTYLGNLGYPNVHSVFADFATRAQVLTIGDPGHTDAVEFTDGKLMLGKITPMNDVNWSNIVARVGIDRVKALVTESKLLGMVNWTMLPFMKEIWEHMLADVLPEITPPLPPGEGRPVLSNVEGGEGGTTNRRLLFIDLADPEKRTLADIQFALKQITQFQKRVDVILGLNLKEAVQIAQALGHSPKSDPESATEELAREIRGALNIACVVVHPRKGAAAATAGESASFAGPFVKEPKISTGAGDHFNAGFALGRVLNFTLEESLCCGTATSGYYVRSAQSPSAKELAQFCSELPAPQ